MGFNLFTTQTRLVFTSLIFQIKETIPVFNGSMQSGYCIFGNFNIIARTTSNFTYALFQAYSFFACNVFNINKYCLRNSWELLW